MTVRELEIMKSALEGDILRQKESINSDHPAFKEWLKDTEKLLKKVSKRLYMEKSKEELMNKAFNPGKVELHGVKPLPTTPRPPKPPSQN